jgi:hypothetical protein
LREEATGIPQRIFGLSKIFVSARRWKIRRLFFPRFLLHIYSGRDMKEKETWR